MKCFLSLLLAIPLALSGQQLLPLGDLHQPVPRPIKDFNQKFIRAQNRIFLIGKTTSNETGVWRQESAVLRGLELDVNTKVAAWAEADSGFFYLTQTGLYDYQLMYHPGEVAMGSLLDFLSFVPYEIDLAALGNQVVYPKQPDVQSPSVWISGTQPGSQVKLADLPAGQQPFNFVRSGSLVYFRTGDGPTDSQLLWRTDGTPAGTFPVLTLPPYTAWDWFTNPHTMRDLGGRLLFIVRGPSVGFQLWASDGTPASTALVTTVANTFGQLSALSTRIVGDRFVFTVDDGVHGYEWWTSDGTEAGTQLLADVAANGDLDLKLNAYGTAPATDRLFFFHQNELWRTDGTPAGTHAVTSVTDVRIPLTVMGEAYFFIRETTGSQFELWKSDGTAAGTAPVHNIGSLPVTDFTWPVAATDSQLCFLYPVELSNQVMHHRVMCTDGTAAGTVFMPAVPDARLEHADPENFSYGPDGALYFRAQTENGQGTPEHARLWRWTPAQSLQAALVDSNYAGVVGPLETNGILYWLTNSAICRLSDPAGSIQCVTTQPFTLPHTAQAAHGLVYFSYGTEPRLVRSDVSPTGNYALSPVGSTVGPYSLQAVGDSLFFVLTSYNNGDQYSLCTTDGTEAGTVQLEPIPGVASEPVLFDVNGRLGRASLQTNPWQPTLHVRGFPPLPFPGYTTRAFFSGLEVLPNGELFGLGQRLWNGTSFTYDLWKAVGDTIATLHSFDAILEYDEAPERYRDRLFGLTDRVLFAAGPAGNVELWTSDGTAGGTVQLLDINPLGSAFPDDFVRYDSATWLFSAFDGGQTAWWRTDGTAAGTSKLLEVSPLSDAHGRTVTGAAYRMPFLLFGLDDGVHGREPWVVVIADDSLTVAAPLTADGDVRLRLWPNPAVEQLCLDVPGQKTGTVLLLDAAGHVVARQALNPSGTTCIPVATLPPGSYFAVVQPSDGRRLARSFLIGSR